VNPLDQLGAMAVFARIVDTLSYTQAAASLGVAKSSVSKDIARLEASLGVVLLRRTTRKIEVTEIGRAYYAYCARVLAEQKGANQFLRQTTEEPVGNLRVTAPVTFGNRAVMPALCRFVERNALVQSDLELTDRTVDPQEADLDVVVVISRDPPDNAQSRMLMPIEWGLYATPDYLSQHPPVRVPDDLRRHGFLSFRGPAHSPALMLRKGKRDVELQVRHLLRVNNSTAVMRGTTSGLGVGYLPQYVANEAVRAGMLTRLLPDWSSETRIAYATYLESRYLLPRVRLFIDTLVEYCQEHGRALRGT
jgi:DNA-binding transcriptional LysR family regulator